MTPLHPALAASFPAPFAQFGQTIVTSDADAIPLPELLGQTRLLQTAARYTASFAGNESRAALSMWSQHYLLALIPCATAALLVAKQDLPLDLDGMAVSLTGEGQPCRLCVPHAGGDTVETCPVRRLAPLLQTHLRPLAGCLATAGLSPLVFWSNAASILAWSLGVIEASKTECGAVCAAMSASHWPGVELATPNPFRQVIGDSPAKRRVCCLRHRLSCMTRCADCPATRCQ